MTAAVSAVPTTSAAMPAAMTATSASASQGASTSVTGVTSGREASAAMFSQQVDQMMQGDQAVGGQDMMKLLAAMIALQLLSNDDEDDKKSDAMGMLGLLAMQNGSNNCGCATHTSSTTEVTTEASASNMQSMAAGAYQPSMQAGGFTAIA